MILFTICTMLLRIVSTVLQIYMFNAFEVFPTCRLSCFYVNFWRKIFFFGGDLVTYDT